MDDKITAVRKSGPNWIFKWVEGEGWMCKKRVHLYRLWFNSDEFKQVWVGRQVNGPDPEVRYWVQVDSELGIVCLECKKITVVFKGEN
jgi:hypothetical protein